MNPVEKLQRLRAMEALRAMPIATVRHVRLVDRPLVVLAYHLAGDEGAPLAFVLGSERDASEVMIVCEPRNRDRRFTVLARVAATLATYCADYTTTTLEMSRRRTGEAVQVPIAA